MDNRDTMAHCYNGAIVKYNPCSAYARGSPCPYFDKGRKCDKPTLSCEMYEYDKWYKDVTGGKTKCYYPYHILRLFPGACLFVYHYHHAAIMGEAEISKITREGKKYFYWFYKFVLYKNPVQLELLDTDPRLPRMTRHYRWLWIYINKATIDEIRNLSNLSNLERSKLGKDLSIRQAKLEKTPFLRTKSKRTSSKFRLELECIRLSEKMPVSDEILIEVKKVFSEAASKKLTLGFAFRDVFYPLLYLSSRMLDTPLLVDQIAEISGISPIKICKFYRYFAKELHLRTPFLTPEKLIDLHNSQLDLSREAIKEAKVLSRRAKNVKELKHVTPSSLAAISTYIVSSKYERKTQKFIADVFNVSTQTIRNYYKILENAKSAEG